MGYWRTLANAQVSGTAITAAAAASLLPPQAKATIDGNFFNNAGVQVVVEASGVISSIIATPGTARFDLRLGGTVLFDTKAMLLDSVAAHTSVPWYLRIWLTLRLSGSAGNFWGISSFLCEDLLGSPASAPKGSLVAIAPWNTTPAIGGNADLTAAGLFDLQFTQTETTGSCQLHQYSLSVNC